MMGHFCLIVRADLVARAEPRHVESSVRTVHQRRRYGTERHSPLSKEICHYVALQTYLIYGLLRSV